MLQLSRMLMCASVKGSITDTPVEGASLHKQSWTET